MAYLRLGRTNGEYRGMKISVVRVTNDHLIKNRAARALLKARAQCINGLKELLTVMPRSLVETRSLIEMSSSEGVRGRVGAEPIEMRPQLFLFKGRSQTEAQSRCRSSMLALAEISLTSSPNEARLLEQDQEGNSRRSRKG